MRIVLVISLLALAGCNTMSGLGHDMQNAGSNFSNKADQPHQQHQQRMAYPDDAEPEPY